MFAVLIVDVIVVVVVECDFSRIGRKGRVFYIHKAPDKGFSTCSLSVEDHHSLFGSTCAALSPAVCLHHYLSACPIKQIPHNDFVGFHSAALQTC